MLALDIEHFQHSFLVQPIWETLGKSPKLANNCLDIFVWSNAGFMKFISDIASKDSDIKAINRQTRTVIWLYKMLSEIKENKKFNHRQIVNQLTYNTKNDKAFASSGNITNRYMSCPRLIKPVIKNQRLGKLYWEVDKIC